MEAFSYGSNWSSSQLLPFFVADGLEARINRAAARLEQG